MIVNVQTKSQILILISTMYRYENFKIPTPPNPKMTNSIYMMIYYQNGQAPFFVLWANSGPSRTWDGFPHGLNGSMD